MMIIAGRKITRGLIIDYPWVDYILDGVKCWEMRTSKTQRRGDIALIAKGTGTIVGVAKLVDCIDSLPIEELVENRSKHMVDYAANPELVKWDTPWVLENIERVEPLPYNHRSGAVIWVRL